MARPGPRGGQYRPLSADQIQEIHQASLNLLQETGIATENERALALLAAGGARVAENRVFIPPEVVATALERAPSAVLLAGRNPQQDIVLEETRVYAGTGGSPTMILDPGADAVRPGTLQDLADLVRLVNSLENCDFVVLPLYPTDLPGEIVPVNRFYAALSNTGKHVMGGVDSVDGAREVIELATMLAGDLETLQKRPFVSAITSWMVSPLSLDTEVTDILIEWCSHGLPLALSSAPMAGSTAPITLAGTLVQLNAEQLSGIVLSQLVRPGTPVLAGYVPGLADMRSGNYLGGAIEFGMMQAAAAQLAHFYQVPIYGSGGMTDSKLPDAQAGYEKMATFLLAAMGGCNYIHHAVGMITNMAAASLEQAVIDDEIIGMARQVLKGIPVTPDTLASTAIQEVGPGGHFLLADHTVRHMRSAVFYPQLADRRNRAAWEAAGKLDTRQRAIARVKQILAKQRPAGLPAEIDRAIRERFDIRLADSS